MVVDVGVAVWTVMTRFLILYCGQFWMDIIVPTLIFSLFQLLHVTDNDFTDNDNFLIRNLFDNNQHISSRLLKKLDLNVR